jgi:hypothetical protein
LILDCIPQVVDINGSHNLMPMMPMLMESGNLCIMVDCSFYTKLLNGDVIYFVLFFNEFNIIVYLRLI